MHACKPKDFLLGTSLVFVPPVEQTDFFLAVCWAEIKQMSSSAHAKGLQAAVMSLAMAYISQ